MTLYLTIFLKILKKNVILLTMFCLKETYFSGFTSCKKKIQIRIQKGSRKNELVKEISSCVEERFNGFDIICHELDKKVEQNFETIDVIYKPVSFFTDEIRLAYRAYFQHGKNGKFESRTAEQCYYCSAFVVGKPKLEKH